MQKSSHWNVLKCLMAPIAYTQPVSIKHGLRTMDCELGIKQGLAIKCGLRTEYKTRTRYKMRTMDYVYKNSFRKVKLRETQSGLAKTVVAVLTFL